MACRVATTADIADLAAGAPDNVDGINPVAQYDWVLVKSQTDASENGIYEVTTLGTGADGVWTRRHDLDNTNEIRAGIIVFVMQGTANAGKMYGLDYAASYTLDTTDLDWTEITEPKSNRSASVAPVATDDSGSGYAVGSRWFDTTADKEYVCLDATATAAVWTETTQGGGGGTPGGADTQVQFNDSGSFGGDADFTWDKTTNELEFSTDAKVKFGGSNWHERYGSVSTGHYSIQLDANNNQSDAKFGIYSNSSTLEAGTELYRVQEDGNIGLNGADTFGTNAAGVLGIKAGTAPTTQPADIVQEWVDDYDGAGTAAMHLMTEQGATLIFAGKEGTQHTLKFTKSFTDDETLTLPSPTTTGYLLVSAGDAEAGGFFGVGTSMTQDYTTGMAIMNADMDGNVDLYYDTGVLTLKNRLGATRVLTVTYCFD
tara:strand:+ start:14408 stop:15694 length:1287 start_codon:yes stop_codon:yes gene_type:complete